MKPPFDALLIASFGGPEKMEDIGPFLDNVLRGKNVPSKRRNEVAHHYEIFNGVSPINEQNREFRRLLEAEFKTHQIDLPIFWGNRNWKPYFPDVLRDMRTQGVKRALAYATSAYSSYSGCRQYLEDFERARNEIGEGAPEIEKIQSFYNHSNFLRTNILRVKEALSKLGEEVRNIHIAFTAHSVPTSMKETSDYVRELQFVAKKIAQNIQPQSWKVVYQSRSGSPDTPWLEPDINDHLKSLHGGVQNVIIAPIGFVSDHMEVLYDLDIQAKGQAERLGLRMVRAETVGNHPLIVSMVRELVEERFGGER